MASRDDQYDPYIPAGGAPAGRSQGSAGGARRPEDIQQELDAATAAMQANVNKLSQRGENLNSLQDKTGTLADSAMNFKKTANQKRKEMWKKNMKMKIFIAIGIIVLLLVIILPSVLANK